MARVSPLFAYWVCDIGISGRATWHVGSLIIDTSFPPSEVRSLCLHYFHLVESYCIPNFDSPSVFARILDKNKVGIRFQSSGSAHICIRAAISRSRRLFRLPQNKTISQVPTCCKPSMIRLWEKLLPTTDLIFPDFSMTRALSV